MIPARPFASSALLALCAASGCASIAGIDLDAYEQESAGGGSDAGVDSGVVADTGAGGHGGSGGTGGGGSAGGSACTNAADMDKWSGGVAKAKAEACGTTHLGAEPATKDCILAQTGLSNACATCFDEAIRCAAEHCLSPCVAGPGTQPCLDCRKQYCDAAFVSCAGIAAN